MAHKYRLCLSYDGSNYSGWQVQPDAPSIQGLIEEALATVLKSPVRVIGAGRTDAGVHAHAQTAHFSFEKDLECDSLQNALNGLLPPQIRVQTCQPAHETFHAQYSAVSKEYHYHLWLGKTIPPFYRLYTHRLYDSRFSLPLLKQAAQIFVGTHDFATFANVGSCVKSTTRTLFRLDIVEQQGGIRLEFEGDGFLYKMVRNLVGTLLEVATQRRALHTLPQLLAAKDRRQAGLAAPAKGLFLVKVNYPTSVGFCNSMKEETC